MKKNKSFNLNFGTILLALAALVNLARWIGIYTYTKNAPEWVSMVIPVLDAISGLFTGLVIAGGMAFIAHRLGSLQPLTPKGKPVMRFWMTAIGGLAILIMSAFLLPPYVRMTMPDDLRKEIKNLDVWSTMAVLVGDLIVVAIAGADSKAAGFTRSADEQPHSKPQSETSGVAKTRSATKSERSAKDKQPLVLVACRYEGAGCKKKGTQNAMNAHAPHCEFKPSIDDRLLIKSKQEKQHEA